MIKRTSIYLFLSAFLSVLVFAGGIQDSPADNGKHDSKLEITDSTGNSVVLKDTPERIAFAGRASIMVADAMYMFPEALERVVSVGFTNQGRGNFTAVLDPEYDKKTYLDYKAGPEQIAGTKPDLVIMKNYMKKNLGNPVNQLGIPVIYLSLETPEQYETDFRVLGKVFNDEKRAEDIIRFYRESQERITSRTAGLTDRPEVLFIYHSTRDGEVAFNVPPKTWIQTRMIQMAGGIPVWADQIAGKGWTKVNFEQIAVWNPDQIFVVAYKQDEKEVVKKLLASSRWKNLKAVRNGKVKAFPVDFYSWDQPDSRWILGAAWLANEIHPELFSDFDIQETTMNFYRELYFMSDRVFTKEIKARLGW